jgi:hypothetical protein
LAAGRAVDLLLATVFAGVVDFFAALPVAGAAAGGVTVSPKELEQINVRSAIRGRVT